MRTCAWMLIAAMFAGIATVPATAAPVPATSCEVFPSDNVWRLDVSKLPVDRHSDIWMRAMHARHTFLHPDFGPPSYGIPFDVVDASHADVSVEFTYADESDPGPYPFGADTQSRAGRTGTRS